tara:strand:+ start:227 stop:460 length:234 start_codon:yes stop_codon:yes gene_type:complete
VAVVADQMDREQVMMVVLVVEDQITVPAEMAQQIRDMLVQKLIMTQMLVVAALVQLLSCHQHLNQRLEQISQLVRVA